MSTGRSSPAKQLWAFAALVVALGAATALARLGRDVTPFVLVLIPPAAALVVAGVSGGRADVRSLFGRLGRWRVGWPWYLAAIGIPVAEKLVVDAAGLALGVTTPVRLVEALTLSALFIPLVVLVPAMLEEFGWRGFGVQTAADGGRSPAWAAAVVGVVFVLLHVPLHLPGQLYDGLPGWPAPVILLVGSVLLTWVYLRTGSILLTGLMHASLNATFPLTWGVDAVWVWQARAFVLAAIAVTVVVASGRRWWLRGEPARRGSTRRAARAARAAGNPRTVTRRVMHSADGPGDHLSDDRRPAHEGRWSWRAHSSSRSSELLADVAPSWRGRGWTVPWVAGWSRS